MTGNETTTSQDDEESEDRRNEETISNARHPAVESLANLCKARELHA